VASSLEAPGPVHAASANETNAGPRSSFLMTPPSSNAVCVSTRRCDHTFPAVPTTSPSYLGALDLPDSSESLQRTHVAADECVSARSVARWIRVGVDWIAQPEGSFKGVGDEVAGDEAVAVFGSGVGFVG